MHLSVNILNRHELGIDDCTFSELQWIIFRDELQLLSNADATATRVESVGRIRSGVMWVQTR